MNRNLLIFVLILSMTFGLNIPAYAAGSSAVVSSHDDSDKVEVTGTYTLTKTAHVLYIEGYENDSLVVYFEPFKFAQKGDTAQQLQKLSNSGAVIIDSEGKALQSVLVPGQEVKVTFTYQMREYGTYKENGETYPARRLEIIGCQKLELVGKTLLYGKYGTMQPNVLLGTVLTVSPDKLSVFVEGGLVYDNNFEYIAQGQKTLSLDSNTKVYDKSGNSVRVDELKPFQRVQIKIIGSEWLDSAPPQFSGGVCGTVKMLEHGDKWLSRDTETREITVAVEKQQKDAYGAIELLVQPTSPYERYRHPKIILSEAIAPDIDFSSYTSGTILTASYLAVNNNASPAVYCYITAITPNAERRMTEQELSGVFGKPGDVTLTVKPSVLTPDIENINVVWTNKTDSSLWLTNGYWLETKKNGEWVEFVDPNYKEAVAVIPEGPYASPHADTEFSYAVMLYTDRLDKGAYRIVTSFSPWVSENVPMQDYLITSTEFTIE